MGNIPRNVFDLHKCETSPNSKPEVDLRRFGRHRGKLTRKNPIVADDIKAKIEARSRNPT